MEKVARVALPEFARGVLERLPQKEDKATTITLSGELGSGKTAFVQALGKELGIAETVQSPTFVLVRKYRAKRGGHQEKFNTLVHIDLYRLGSPEELAALKLEEVFRDPKSLVCIEWPERAGGHLPHPDLALSFSSEGCAEDERYIDSEAI